MRIASFINYFKKQCHYIITFIYDCRTYRNRAKTRWRENNLKSAWNDKIQEDNKRVQFLSYRSNKNQSLFLYRSQLRSKELPGDPIRALNCIQVQSFFQLPFIKHLLFSRAWCPLLGRANQKIITSFNMLSSMSYSPYFQYLFNM